ncbi:MAG: leucyl/phenylalanyl-tRNA--protein transferase [Planctomycetes bacterium]|nr:leucyl/phenylalanyl-tRNA--protein transferase [Planctomycetota bacterium]
MSRTRRQRGTPVYLEFGAPVWFPDPREYDADGLVAVGGDLSTPRLLGAYAAGIFPWYEQGILPMWWSPDPRGVLTPASLHVSRSLRRRARQRDFTLTWNQCFQRVMAECGRERAHGSWVIPEMVAAYERLHRLGQAHSLEVWLDGELVGGLYGVQVGALFAAESMFHRATDMSKIALAAAVPTLFTCGIELFDVQFVTAHLATLGAFTMTRADYLQRLTVVTRKQVLLQPQALLAAWPPPPEPSADSPAGPPA